MLSSRCQMNDVESQELFEICQVALGGLLAALRIPDHPHMTSLLLHQTVEGVYGYLSAQECSGNSNIHFV